MQGRYHRNTPIDKTCLETEALELETSRTALIGMHCWNIGCEDGPPIDPNYCVGMGFPETFKEAERIMRECIRPAMDAARRTGVLVCHVESGIIGRKHAEAMHDVEEAPDVEMPGPVVPGWREKMVARFHGEDCFNRPPLSRMDRARVVQPLPGEPFVFQTGQFDRVLRRHGIENLIYTGFATDMCILRAAGGIEPMAPFGYRIFLMRDATVGVECPDTFEERIATRWAIRYHETHYGDTIELADFLKACEDVSKE
jgi:nicotinamidase-related amidase